MKAILKGRWVVVAIWAICVALLVITAPDMAELVREKGQIEVPDGYSSTVAQTILDEMNQDGDGSGGSQIALVFHDPDGLDDADIAEVKRAVEKLQANDQRLGITSVVTHFEQEALEEQLVSADGKTILTALNVVTADRELKEVRDALYAEIADTPVDHYYTGAWLVAEDVVTSSEEGLRKTELITIIFILLVLIIVFRSVVAPIIPLVTVGLSYITAQSIVAFLADAVNFPLSTFTQVFLVAVLFGIGTDYCILLLSRFKEELANKGELYPAIIETYRTAGKTVFVSALVVLIGFSAIGFSTFKLYQSAAAVAIGVAALIAALMTVVPFFMAVLGTKLFWPSKKAMEHRDSRIWDWAGKFSLARPFATLLIVAAIVAPFFMTYDGNLSFNSLDEIGEDYDSVKAFTIIADSFGPGEAMPAKIVIQHDRELNTSDDLATIEKISREVEKIDSVESVRSATRPTGEELTDLQVANQVETLNEGLGEGNEGLEQIRDGLKEASDSMTASAPEIAKATDGVGELIAGTNELRSGVNELADGLSQLEQGLRDGSAGAVELKKGLAQAASSAKQLAAANRELRQGYQKAAAGLTPIAKGLADVEQGLQEMSGVLGQVNESLQNLTERHPELATDQEFVMVQQMVQGVKAGMDSDTGLISGIKQLNQGLSAVQAGLTEANQGLSQTVAGQEALNGGFDELVKGLSDLQQGIEQAADGQKEINSHIPAVSSGLNQIGDGQQELQAGFADLDGQLAQLTDGLDRSVDGLNEVVTGLRSAQDYLDELARTSKDDMSGWFIPQDVLESDDFKQVFDVYMSKDRQVTTLDVVLNTNPYAIEAMDKVGEIKEAVERATKGTDLEDATVAISGVSSMNNDLGAISDADFSRTVILMLLAIAIILIALFRSVIMPLYLMLSLILTYFTSMGIAEVVFVDIGGYPGLSWAVPFFSFVILIALGVDYSIFLMSRFNEYKDGDAQEGIRTAMRKMGTVIISAVIILGGTFAAMYPSGVLSLLQIATVTISGLLLYAFVFLPFFVPVMVKTFGKANWWPFNQSVGDRNDLRENQAL